MNFTQVNAIWLMLAAIFFAVRGDHEVAASLVTVSVLAMVTANLLGYISSLKKGDRT